MTLAIRQFALQNHIVGGNVSVTLPMVPQPGNLLVAIASMNTTTNFPLTGWSGIILRNSGTPFAWLNISYYKYAGPGETAIQTPFTGPSQCVCAIYELEGVIGTWGTGANGDFQQADGRQQAVSTTSYDTIDAHATDDGLVLGIMSGLAGATPETTIAVAPVAADATLVDNSTLPGSSGVAAACWHEAIADTEIKDWDITFGVAQVGGASEMWVVINGNTTPPPPTVAKGRLTLFGVG